MSISIARVHAESTISAVALRGARTIARCVASLWTAMLHRRDVRLLLELNDRELHDIGLLRNDVLGALAHPLTQDPSRVLCDRSVDRRSRVRSL